MRRTSQPTARLADQQVGGLHVAVEHPSLVRRVQRFGTLPGDRQKVAQGQVDRTFERGPSSVLLPSKCSSLRNGRCSRTGSAKPQSSSRMIPG